MKKLFLGILVLFILIQFIRPDKNMSEHPNLISTELRTTLEIETLLLTSCADCHSDNTEYPWYADIAPVSWYIANHVNDGKRHLNFTQWSSYNTNQKSHIINDLKDELSDQKMPLKSYLILHENATLNSDQYQQLLTWVETLKID